jgi:hypothetical protein
MLRYIRKAANRVTLGAVAAAMPILAAAPAGAMPMRVWQKGPSHAHHRRHSTSRAKLFGITPKMMAAAAHVSRCEEGGNWHFVGTSFDGGVGWTPENWVQFRRPTWPRFMHDAPPHMQANALFRFVWHYGIAMPDQNGWCSSY